MTGILRQLLSCFIAKGRLLFSTIQFPCTRYRTEMRTFFIGITLGLGIAVMILSVWELRGVNIREKENSILKQGEEGFVIPHIEVDIGKDERKENFFSDQSKKPPSNSDASISIESHSFPSIHPNEGDEPWQGFNSDDFYAPDTVNVDILQSRFELAEKRFNFMKHAFASNPHGLKREFDTASQQVHYSRRELEARQHAELHDAIAAELHSDGVLGKSILLELNRPDNNNGDFSMAHWGSGDGNFSLTIAKLFPKCSVISFSLSSVRRMSIHDIALAKANLQNNIVVHPTLLPPNYFKSRVRVPHEKVIWQKRNYFENVEDTMRCLARTPEFFEYQVYNHYESWTNSETDGFFGLLKRLFQLGRTTFLILPQALANHDLIVAEAASFKVDIAVLELGSVVINGEHIKLLRVDLITLLGRRVVRYVKEKCEYILTFERGQLYQEKTSIQCAGFKSMRKFKRPNSGTSVATLLSLRLSLVSRFMLIGMLIPFNGPGFNIVQTSTDNIMCCRSGRLEPIDSAFRAAHPICGGTHLIQSSRPENFTSLTVGARLVKQSSNDAFTMSDVFYTNNDSVWEPERFQALAHEIFGCQNGWWPGMAPQWKKNLFNAVGENNYCDEVNGIARGQSCLMRSLMRIVVETYDSSPTV